MSSQYKTPQLKLNDWVGIDRVERKDWVNDNKILEKVISTGFIDFEPVSYVSSNQFTVPEDQTSIFITNRRIKAEINANFLYSSVENVVYNSTDDLTTVTIKDNILTSDLNSIGYGNIIPGNSGNLPLEALQDTVSNLISAGNNIDLNYDDVNNQLIISVNGTALNADTLDGKHLSEIISTAVPPGTVIWRAVNNIPNGYLECNGAELSRTTYSDLFGEIGTVFGSGDGSTTFNLPDLRGEFVRGFDNGRGVDSGRDFGSWQDFGLKLPFPIRQPPDGFTTDGTLNNVPLSFTVSDDIPNPHLKEDWENLVDEIRSRNVALLPLIKY